MPAVATQTERRAVVDPDLFWSAVGRWLRENSGAAVKSMAMGGLVSFGLNFVMSLKLFAGRFDGAQGLFGGAVNSSLFFGVLSTVVFALIGYRRAAGKERFWRAVGGAPDTVAMLFREDGGAARVHLFWGLALSLVTTQFVSPWLGAAVATGFLATAPSPVGRVFAAMASRLWIGLTRAAAPTRGLPVEAPAGWLVGMIGAAAALVLGDLVPGARLKLALAAACVVAAFVMSRRRPDAAASVLLVGGAALLVLGLADVLQPLAAHARPVPGEMGGLLEGEPPPRPVPGEMGGLLEGAPARPSPRDAAVTSVGGLVGGFVGAPFGSALGAAAARTQPPGGGQLAGAGETQGGPAPEGAPPPPVWTPAAGFEAEPQGAPAQPIWTPAVGLEAEPQGAPPPPVWTPAGGLEAEPQGAPAQPVWTPAGGLEPEPQGAPEPPIWTPAGGDLEPESAPPPPDWATPGADTPGDLPPIPEGAPLTTEALTAGPGELEPAVEPGAATPDEGRTLWEHPVWQTERGKTLAGVLRPTADFLWRPGDKEAYGKGGLIPDVGNLALAVGKGVLDLGGKGLRLTGDALSALGGDEDAQKRIGEGYEDAAKAGLDATDRAVATGMEALRGVGDAWSDPAFRQALKDELEAQGQAYSDDWLTATEDPDPNRRAAAQNRLIQRVPGGANLLHATQDPDMPVTQRAGLGLAAGLEFGGAVSLTVDTLGLGRRALSGVAGLVGRDAAAGIATREGGGLLDGGARVGQITDEGAGAAARARPGPGGVSPEPPAGGGGAGSSPPGSPTGGPGALPHEPAYTGPVGKKFAEHEGASFDDLFGDEPIVPSGSPPQGPLSPEVQALVDADVKLKRVPPWEGFTDQQMADVGEATHDVLVKAYKAEPAITDTVQSVTKDLGGRLKGLEYVKKDPGSLARKVSSDVKEAMAKDGVSAQVAAARVGDAVRYTAAFPPGLLVQKTQQIITELRNKGYTFVKDVKNTWIDDKKSYKGINAQLIAPNGQQFELQFHTHQSYWAKGKGTHHLYEEMRIVPEGSPRWHELNNAQFAVAARLRRPTGVESLTPERLKELTGR